MIYNFVSTDYQNGNITNSGGWTTQNNRIRPNDFIYVTSNPKSITIDFSGNNTNLEAVISLATNSYLVNEFYWLSTGATVDTSSYTFSKFAVIFRRTDNLDLSPTALRSLTVTTPGAWAVDGDVTFHTDSIQTPNAPFQGDSPYNFWRINPNVNNGNPYIGLTIQEPLLGAFTNAKDLKTITIPASVKHIGPFTFFGTALRSVTIASDCTYESTSFPPGCIINYYPSGGD
jgi:hypothetical protein